MSTVTDPIADLLARMRNGARAQKMEIFVPYSKIKAEVVRILKNEGYITDYEVDTKADRGRSAYRVVRAVVHHNMPEITRPCVADDPQRPHMHDDCSVTIDAVHLDPWASESDPQGDLRAMPH